MAAWKNLPFEIREKILYWFCLTTLDAYVAFPRFFISARMDVQPVNPHAGPIPPEPLRDFSSALLTCQDFKTIITNLKVRGIEKALPEIKKNGVQPLSFLQQVQVHQVLSDSSQRLVRGVSRLSVKPQNTDDFGYVTQMRPLSDNVRYVPPGRQSSYLENLVRALGPFWRNPLIVEPSYLLMNLFLFFDQRDRTIFLPRLRDWVSCHYANSTNSTSSERYDQTIYLRDKQSFWKRGEKNAESGFPVKLSVSGGLGSGLGAGVMVLSIHGACLGEDTAPTEGENKGQPLNKGECASKEDSLSGGNAADRGNELVGDIKGRTSRKWWFFNIFGEEDSWYIVKYAEHQGVPWCKLYLGPGGDSMYYLDSFPWDCSLWPKLGRAES